MKRRSRQSRCGIRRQPQRRGARLGEFSYLTEPLGIELLEQRTLLAADFGDAPAPYPTTLADNGAQHEATGPMLGPTRDAEADGVPSSAADGDGADEDGVTFGTIRVGQLDATVTVNVQNAPAGAKLDAWIDFNGDGNWGGPGERIFASAAVEEGDNVLQFDVPSWARTGDTLARLRLSTVGFLGFHGVALGGEVEDYPVMVEPPARRSDGFSAPQTISTSDNGANSVFAADIDGDGDMDVLAASGGSDTVAWYENDGNQAFTQHVISDSARGAINVFAADVDGDGDMDALSASADDDTIAWYENDGNQAFSKRVISNSANWAWTVFAADVDGDGDIDVLSSSATSIAWYENDGNQNFSARSIGVASGPSSVFAADVDGDGDLDVLSAASG
ncbi:MAG: VCBS repeat-containing protein, partial [Planctomycetales bacterium]|nr:VCBS repeat-containing protein [Planctomycetales bacterium]